MKELVKNKIFLIRGVQVMLDRDLADFYEIKSFRLREQVKRNINRFPKEFMFQLDDEEVKFMVSQNAIPSKKHLGGSLPFVFTEQGVAMLAGILRSEKAIKVSIEIINAFVLMRKVIKNNNLMDFRLSKVEKRLIEYDYRFDALEGKLEPFEGIFYEGEIFDAYKFVCGLIRKAKRKIILIDNYIDERTLEILSKNKNVKIKVYTNSYSKLDMQKFISQYFKIKIYEKNEFHDRFLIIDDKLYHIGASLKDLGLKCFAFSKLDLIEEIKQKLDFKN